MTNMKAEATYHGSGALPSDAPPVLLEAFNKLSTPRRAAFYDHLVGGTGADYLADWMKRAGAPVGATTIKRYRRRLTNG